MRKSSTLRGRARAGAHWAIALSLILPQGAAIADGEGFVYATGYEQLTRAIAAASAADEFEPLTLEEFGQLDEASQARYLDALRAAVEEVDAEAAGSGQSAALERGRRLRELLAGSLEWIGGVSEAQAANFGLGAFDAGSREDTSDVQTVNDTPNSASGRRAVFVESADGVNHLRTEATDAISPPAQGRGRYGDGGAAGTPGADGSPSGANPTRQMRVSPPSLTGGTRGDGGSAGTAGLPGSPAGAAAFNPSRIYHGDSGAVAGQKGLPGSPSGDAPSRPLGSSSASPKSESAPASAAPAPAAPGGMAMNPKTQAAAGDPKYCINAGVLQPCDGKSKRQNDFRTQTLLDELGAKGSKCAANETQCSPVYGFRSNGALFCSANSTPDCARKSQKEGGHKRLLEVMKSCSSLPMKPQATSKSSTFTTSVNCGKLGEFMAKQTAMLAARCSANRKAACKAAVGNLSSIANSLRDKNDMNNLSKNLTAFTQRLGPAQAVPDHGQAPRAEPGKALGSPTGQNGEAPIAAVSNGSEASIRKGNETTPFQNGNGSGSTASSLQDI